MHHDEVMEDEQRRMGIIENKHYKIST